MRENVASVNERLRRAVKEHGVLIASHRGSATSGNIIENTVQAFECGLCQHADIIETDVIRSTDGKLFLFHDSESTKNEQRLLDVKATLRNLSAKEIEALRYRNQQWDSTAYRVNTLDEALDYLKGRCLINIDRSWDIWDSVLPVIEQHGMLDQCIVKSDPEPELLDFMERWEAPVMYMPKAFCAQDVENVRARNINTVATEVIFFDNDADTLDPVAQKEWKKQGILLWSNSLRLRDDWNRSAWHDDNGAILENADAHWGWQVDHGFDILQTDWPSMLHEYLVKHNKRF